MTPVRALGSFATIGLTLIAVAAALWLITRYDT